MRRLGSGTRFRCRGQGGARPGVDGNLRGGANDAQAVLLAGQPLSPAPAGAHAGATTAEKCPRGAGRPRCVDCSSHSVMPTAIPGPISSRVAPAAQISVGSRVSPGLTGVPAGRRRGGPVPPPDREPVPGRAGCQGGAAGIHSPRNFSKIDLPRREKKRRVRPPPRRPASWAASWGSDCQKARSCS